MSQTKFCPVCEDLRETRQIVREESYVVRGRRIGVPVAADVCVACGESLGGDEQDQRILAAVYAEYRRIEGLLTPEQIRGVRGRYNLSQRSLANLLGMSEATINRYEKGMLQEQAQDAAIRACENAQFMKDQLERRGHVLSAWQRRRAEEALAGQLAPARSVIDWPAASCSMPDEVSEHTGFRHFDLKRFAAVAAWFCGRIGRVSVTAINKLVFYADFLCFKSSTVSLTGAAYRRLDYGPVLADYDGLLCQLESEEVLVGYEQGTGKYYQPGPEAATLDVAFTPHELAVLEHVHRELGHETAGKLSDRSHRESAWLNTPDKKLISYREAASLSLSLPEPPK